MVFCNEKVNGKVWFNCSHNPYFNRWFSAINATVTAKISAAESQSLF